MIMTNLYKYEIAFVVWVFLEETYMVNHKIWRIYLEWTDLKYKVWLTQNPFWRPHGISPKSELSPIFRKSAIEVEEFASLSTGKDLPYMLQYNG